MLIFQTQQLWQKRCVIYSVNIIFLNKKNLIMKVIISSALDKAKGQLSGLISIDPKLDLANGLNVATQTAEISSVEAEITNFNTLLATLKATGKSVRAKIKAVNDKKVRFNSAVIAKYTKESEEYVKIGGKRPSEQKRRSPAKLKANADKVA